ncbi:MAG: SDR family oxidoreductase [Candidatus Omnitrophica bacterium]|nr:SDR family oxidoreductase [Candidatus Omnitrophota bacterium]
MKKNTIFLTGATGIFGSYLLKILLQRGHKVYVLSRQKADKNATERIRDVLRFWDNKVFSKHGKTLIIVEGDITEKNLGLSKNNRQLLEKDVEEVYHSAAITDFSWPLKEIRKVNVQGVKNVLDTALTWQKHGCLKKIEHISTAYVCGTYKGVFRESDLDVGQGFNTTYEQSKFEAEILVRKYREKGLWIDVFRPSMVVGDSREGKIPEFKNIYLLLSTTSLGIFDILPVLGFNVSLTPIDLTAWALYLLSQRSSARNETYNIFPTKAISLKKLIEFVVKKTGKNMPKLISLSQLKLDALTPVQRKLFEKSFLLLNPEVRLDSICTNNVLKKYGFRWGVFNLKAFFEYFFGKKIMSKNGRLNKE